MVAQQKRRLRWFGHVQRIEDYSKSKTGKWCTGFPDERRTEVLRSSPGDVRSLAGKILNRWTWHRKTSVSKQWTTSSCRGHVDELATEPFLLLHREHGTGYRRSWNCCDRRTCFVVIWKHFCFILSTGTRIRIDSVMRPRSSSRGRSTSASVTVTVTERVDEMNCPMCKVMHWKDKVRGIM